MIGSGRTCSHEGCETRLSRYNSDALCRVHNVAGGRSDDELISLMAVIHRDFADLTEDEDEVQDLRRPSSRRVP
jgi:hypothetical protein